MQIINGQLVSMRILDFIEDYHAGAAALTERPDNNAG